MFKGNYSCNRAVIFEVAIFLLLSLFWTNHNSNHQLPSTFSNHQLPSISPNTPTMNNIASPSSQKRHHLCASRGEIRSNGIAANRREGFPRRSDQDRCFHARPLAAQGQRSEVRDQRPNRVSPTRYKGARSVRAVSLEGSENRVEA